MVRRLSWADISIGEIVPWLHAQVATWLERGREGWDRPNIHDCTACSQYPLSRRLKSTKQSWIVSNFYSFIPPRLAWIGQLKLGARHIFRGLVTWEIFWNGTKQKESWYAKRPQPHPSTLLHPDLQSKQPHSCFCIGTLASLYPIDRSHLPEHPKQKIRTHQTVSSIYLFRETCLLLKATQTLLSFIHQTSALSLFHTLHHVKKQVSSSSTQASATKTRQDKPKFPHPTKPHLSKSSSPPINQKNSLTILQTFASTTAPPNPTSPTARINETTLTTTDRHSYLPIQINNPNRTSSVP